MGLFDKLFSSKNTTEKLKSYDKYGNILKKLLTTKEQRLEAIDALKSLDPEYSTPQLLKRFEIIIDSGMQDTKEKEQCLEIIVGYGEKAKHFVKEVIETKRRISWPLKIAERLFSHEDYVNLVLNNLNPNIAVFDEDSLERNEEMLLALKEVKVTDDSVVEKVSQFLSSHDGNIRMAALECLEEQAVTNVKAKEIILNFAKEQLTDDNSRFLGVVKSIIEKNKWK